MLESLGAELIDYSGIVANNTIFLLILTHLLFCLDAGAQDGWDTAVPPPVAVSTLEGGAPVVATGWDS